MDYYYVLKLYAVDEIHFMSGENPDCYNYASDSRP